MVGRQVPGSRGSVVHALDAGGFERHTFLCGQSGSGKTYALGVLLEQLLLETSLRDRRARPELGLRAPRRAARGRRARRWRRAIATRPRAPCTARPPRRRTACGCASRELGTAGAPRRCGSIRSATATSTPSSTAAARAGAARGARASSPGRGARRRRARAAARATSASTAGACGRAETRARRSTRSRTRPCAALVVDLGSLATREEQALVARGGARAAVGAAHAARAGADRDRRGAQRLPGRARPTR